MGSLAQGLILSLTGMTITFLALGSIILAIVVLRSLFRPRPVVTKTREREETQVLGSLARDTKDDEIVAAIAVALAHLRSLDLARSGLGMALEAGRGPWWTMGQVEQQRPPNPRTTHGRS